MLGEPLHGRHPGACETFQPLDIWFLRVEERTDRRYHEPCGNHLTVREIQPPVVVFLIPFLVAYLDAETEMRPKIEFFGNAPMVGLHLRSRGKDARPLRIARERELIDHRRNVDGDPRVHVVAPRAAQIVGPIDDHEILYSGLLQAHSCAEAAYSRTDDDDMVVRNGCSHVEAPHSMSRKG
ncbi:Uncharacterised protein [Mycobacteroides abscessus subsp. abscessus]|nr:Uncharacterised protein [Mycobacteroides abscessus subsp. abscessus]